MAVLNGQKRIYSSLIGKIKRKIKIIREKLMGLDFTKTVDNKSLGLDEFGEGIFYAPSENRDLEKILNTLRISPLDRILDYGAGKGAAMMLMDNYDFAEVAGVEISKELCEIAKKNFKHLQKPHLKVYESDAREFSDIERFTHFYFLHPFPPDVMEVVLNNIRDSFIKNLRKVNLIYYSPAHKNVFEERNDLFLNVSIKGWRYETNICTERWTKEEKPSILSFSQT